MPSLELAELEARRATYRLLDDDEHPALVTHHTIRAVDYIIEYLQEQEEIARKERSKWLKDST